MKIPLLPVLTLAAFTGLPELVSGMGLGGETGGPTGRNLFTPALSLPTGELASKVGERRGGGFVIAIPERCEIRSFDSSGTTDGSFFVSGTPLSVAVLNNDEVLVGNRTYGEVARYTRDGRKVGFLGSGYGEFGQPTDVAVDRRTLRIFVADGLQDCVRVYRWDGMPLLTLGSSGSGAGQLKGPNSVAVDQSTGVAYVSDCGNQRIQAFERDGSFAGTIGVSGSNEGEVFRPSGVAVDTRGRLHVSDSFQGWVEVFDRSGTYLGWAAKYGAAPGRLLNPGDVAVDAAGRLVVTMSGDAKVEVYDDALGASSVPGADSMPAMREAVVAFPEGVFDRGATAESAVFRVALWGISRPMLDKDSILLNGELAPVEIHAVEGQRSGVFEFGFARGEVARMVDQSGGALVATVQGAIKGNSDVYRGSVRISATGTPAPDPAPTPSAAEEPEGGTSSAGGCGGPGSGTGPWGFGVLLLAALAVSRRSRALACR